MTRVIPPFRPVSLVELRRIWVDYPQAEIRRLTLEVERYRRLFAEVDQLCATVHQAWREEVGGDLIALHMLKLKLSAERDRV